MALIAEIFETIEVKETIGDKTPNKICPCDNDCKPNICHCGNDCVCIETIDGERHCPSMIKNM